MDEMEELDDMDDQDRQIGADFQKILLEF